MRKYFNIRLYLPTDVLRPLQGLAIIAMDLHLFLTHVSTHYSSLDFPIFTLNQYSMFHLNTIACTAHVPHS